jgi:hypothetical protein
MDLTSGYHQVPVMNSDIPKTEPHHQDRLDKFAIANLEEQVP